MSEEKNQFFTEEDKKALEDFRKMQEENRKKAERQKAREARLGQFLEHPENGSHYKEIYEKHVKEDIESDPGLLDSDSSVKFLFKKGKEAYLEEIERAKKKQQEKDENSKSKPPSDTTQNGTQDANPKKVDPNDLTQYFDPEAQDKLNLSEEAKMMLNVHKK